MRAIISNTNINSIDLYLGDKSIFFDYGQVFQPFIDKSSKLYSEEINEVVVLLDSDELIKHVIPAYSERDFENILKDVTHLLEIIYQYSKEKNCLIIISDFCFSGGYPFTYIFNNSVKGINSLEYELNKLLYQYSSNSSMIQILNWSRIIKKNGFDRIYDYKYYYLGRIKFSAFGLEALANEYKLLKIAISGYSKKVLIIDLDNTLWGGVIGEDGINGIQLSEDGLGKVFRDFQYQIKALGNIGVILCIVSKNNEMDVFEVFTKHPYMILKWDDFVIKKINWDDKFSNICAIQSSLNLGFDSFVFIDDNPVEREQIIKELPSVHVPPFPQQPIEIPMWFINSVIYPNFSKVLITNEDLKKKEQYLHLIERSKLNLNSNMESFINNLQIRIKIYHNDDTIISRIAQMTQKTNQFNLTTKRYLESDIHKFIKTGFDVFALHYFDRFADEGIVGLCITKSNDSAVQFDSFLLSCRIIGRNVEYAFLNWILKYYNSLGMKEVIIPFTKTNKNAVAEIFVNSLIKNGNLPESNIIQLLNIIRDKNVEEIVII